MFRHRFTSQRLTGVFILAVLINWNSLIAEAKEYPIDLNSIPVYVKSGFEKSWLQSTPDNSWLELQPNPRRSVIIPQLPLPDQPKRRFPEFRSFQRQDFSILFLFELKQDDINKAVQPTLFLAQVGESWQIYLNGQLLDSQSAKYPLNQRSFKQPIPVKFLQVGTNYLMVHVSGDPISKETGLYYSEPYLIAEATQIDAQSNQTLTIILITILATIGITPIFFVLTDRSRRYNLFFGLFSLLFALYLFFSSAMPFLFIKNATILFRLEFATLAAITPTFLLLVHSLLAQQSRFVRFLTWLGALHGYGISILTFLVMPNLLYDLLTIWQSSLPLIIFVIEVAIYALFIGDIRRFTKKIGLWQGLRHSAFSRPAGNFAIGTLLLIIPTFYDLYNLLITKINPGTKSYGLIAFLLLGALRLAYEIIALLKTNQNLNTSLRQYIRHMNQLHTVVSKSEEKYRRLIEETKEIVLTLSDAGIITSANSSVQTELGISKETLIGKPFEQLLNQKIEVAGGFSQQFTVNRVREFYTSGRSLNIRAPLFAESKKSHIFFDLKFEKIQSKKDIEIFVKASVVEEDPTLKYLIKETLSFEMENDLFIIEDMVRRLIDDLPRFLDEYEINMIRIGLREVIVNAIEHGNLGISYSEKTDLLHTGNYQDEIQKRLELKEHYNRRVKISISLTPRRVRYRITDEGDGFDHSKFGHDIELNEPTVSLHGRGIFITRNAFNRVIYNESGNSVLLVRDFLPVAEKSHL